MALSETKKRILEAASRFPGSRRVNVEEIALEAECTEKEVLESLQDKEFKDLFLQSLTNSLTAYVPAILNTFVEQAIQGSEKHGKTILEIVGVYQKTSKIQGDIGVSSTGEQPSFKDDKERKEFLQATLSDIMKEGKEESDDA